MYLLLWSDTMSFVTDNFYDVLNVEVCADCSHSHTSKIIVLKVTGNSCTHACILTLFMHQNTQWYSLALSSSIGNLFHVKTYVWYTLAGSSWAFSSSTMPRAGTVGINIVVALTFRGMSPLFAARSSKIVAPSRPKHLLYSAKSPEAKHDTHHLWCGCRSTGRQQFRWLVSHSFLEFWRGKLCIFSRTFRTLVPLRITPAPSYLEQLPFLHRMMVCIALNPLNTKLSCWNFNLVNADQFSRE